MSLAETLRSSVENAVPADPFEITLPTFAPEIKVRLVRIKDAIEREAAFNGLNFEDADDQHVAIEAACRLIVGACKECYTIVDGVETPLPKIGNALHDFIFEDEDGDGLRSDVNALLNLYTGPDGITDTAAIVDAANAYMNWSQTTGLKAQTRVEKKS